MKKWYADQWNISFQRQLGSSWAASANYVTRADIGCRLVTTSIRSVPAGATTGNVNQRRQLYLQNPQQGQYYGNIISISTVGTSIYDALLLRSIAAPPMACRLTGNWTLSRCVTDLINYEPGMAGYALSKPGDVAYDRGQLRRWRP
jgi:hypothetical protein